ncbi:uroporphyrinogen-III C-methyltransferase [Dyella silvatica]|uniref:uroporphyrinogen-III C-methyltransferase n=1 Tax=Dyella silvatica TaxID=2992128 RepID=UPI002259FF82|nr:uroporphyrinogen-III C-methyltransferase [Dyella silvatica]
MSQDDATFKSAAPEGARSDAAPAKPVASVAGGPPPRGGGTLAAAVLLSLLAVAGAGYVGWQQWQQQQGSSSAAQTASELGTRVKTLETTLGSIDSERGLLRQRLGDADQVNRALREELLGQAERTRNLEDAVAKLSEKSLSGQEAMLLDEAESLLRMGKERYDLFHDTQGAGAAYALADQTLAAVNDGAFSGLRQSVAAEREALAKSQPVSQASALNTLTQLRAEIIVLPLKALDSSGEAPTSGTWSRIKQALSGVINVRRDNGAPLAVADARFARELAALDLAQAQVALLAYDRDAYAAALKRVDASLAAQFDLNAPAVQQMRSKLGELAAQLPPTAPVELGAALAELRNLRSIHVLKPAAGGAAAVHPDAAPLNAAPGAKP